MSLILVLCTCPQGEIAERLAKMLVEQKLAACVNINDSIQSVYRWQGKIQQDREALLMIKTSEQLWSRLEQELIRHHPYEVPEIIATPISAGSEHYLSWVEENLCIS